ncbi:MAG: hypothetical protein ABIQ93_15655, partial [Saprospiraceae bacterium]
MKKTTENRSFRTKMFLAAILVSGNFLTVYGQFSSTLGFGFPVSEKGLSGMIATPGPNSGDFVLLGDNVNHPNALAGPNGDMQIIRLDNLGNPIPSSNLLIRPTTDNAAWIERASCGGARYLITGHDQDNILVSMTMLDGVSTWTRSIGSPSPSVETGVWVNMDANGLVDVVGNEYNFSIARLAVVVAQLDCNGNDIWKMSYALNGYELTATSATTFATVPGGINGSCYITGRAIQVGTGIQKVFILRINSTTGSPIFIATYDVAPGWNDVATCIQGSTAPGAQGGLWVSGFSENGNGVLNLLLMKTDLNGNPQWANNYDIPGGDEYATHFEFAANNKLVVTGMGEAGVDGQGNETGYCLLMRVNDTGNTIDWTRLFANKDYSSRGNRVEVTANDEYFITGQSLELLTPVQPAYNILAIKTNPQGLIPNTPCYHDVVTQIIPRSPVMTGASLSLGLVTDNLPTILTNVHYSDQATFCSPVPPQCDFSWTPSGCFQMQFTGTTQYTGTGNYKFVWDIGCDGTPEGTTFGLNSNTSTFNYNFPCGNNTYQVCLKVTDPGGTVCTIMHTVTVGSCECWSTSNP